MPVDVLLDRLDKVKHLGKNKWIACCPAHADRSPSLSIWEPEPDKILIHCFAGCETPDVLAAVDMSISDLFPDRDAYGVHRDSPSYWSRMQKRQQDQNRRDEIMLDVYRDMVRNKDPNLTKEDHAKARAAYLRLKQRAA